MKFRQFNRKSFFLTKRRKWKLRQAEIVISGDKYSNLSKNASYGKSEAIHIEKFDLKTFFGNHI